MSFLCLVIDQQQNLRDVLLLCTYMCIWYLVFEWLLKINSFTNSIQTWVCIVVHVLQMVWKSWYNDSEEAVCVSNHWNVCVIECCSVTGLYVCCGSQQVITPVLRGNCYLCVCRISSHGEINNGILWFCIFFSMFEILLGGVKLNGLFVQSDVDTLDCMSLHRFLVKLNTCLTC